jgi:perosamine synthetase
MNAEGPAVTTQIKAWNAVDELDVTYVKDAVIQMAMGSPTSGFLAGELYGGPLVQRLEDQWANTFKTKYAVSFNSGTSAILAACHAVGFAAGRNVVVPALSMSATASMPAFLGANLIWGDIDRVNFCLDPEWGKDNGNLVGVHGVVLTNLFGNAADLSYWAGVCYARSIPLIEDNCQSAFAKHDGKYAGTWGDIGVFSLNVHKHMQTGEGGIAVTDDSVFAQRMRLFRNHGECARDMIGLNLRMTELTAAMALAQLAKGEKAVHRCRTLATALSHFIYGETPNFSEKSCYAYPLVFPRGERDTWVRGLQIEGVPISAGYASGPLYELPALRRQSVNPNPRCVNAEWVHEHLALIELCAIDPTWEQIEQIAKAFQKVAATLSNPL